MSQFTYDIKYRKSKEHGNADALSRNLCDDTTENRIETEVIINQVMSEQMEVLPVTAAAIRKASSRDKQLSRVMMFVQNGWPEKLNENDKDLERFFHHREELLIVNDVLMWGIRVVIPEKLKEKMLLQLHACHLGIVRMKALARSHIYWPRIDKDIESMCRSCSPCNANRPDPASAPLHPWQYPERPMQRVHMDLAGPFKGKMWLILMDAHTKWPEVFDMKNNTTTAEVKKKVFEFISRWGIMEQIVTDNGTQFASEEFTQFCKLQGIHHIKSTVYHPRTNGEAERFVRSFKDAMKVNVEADVNLRAMKFLFAYRTTPHATTGSSPAELLQGRKLRTVMDLVHPNIRDNVNAAQQRQERGYNSGTKMRRFEVGEDVLVKTFSRNEEKWTRGKIESVIGPLTYQVFANNMLMKRHVDQIRETEADRGASIDFSLEDNENSTAIENEQTTAPSPKPASPGTSSPRHAKSPKQPEVEERQRTPRKKQATPEQQPAASARPKRNVKPRDFFQAGSRK